MQHRISHSLSLELARKATDAALQAYQARFSEYAPKATWTSEQVAEIEFKIKGFTLKGTLTLEATAIVIELNVPFAFRPFRKQALQVIEREIASWIAKAEAGDLN
ncbi:MAG: polyhydroxyalkanoic acid system family protein [Myxococcota bacterium]